jgi:GNAT superfamily N-acetyltransferase
VELARAALGWSPEEPNEAFFRWKHLENPAGASPMWVATEGGRLVGVRVFLRWTFRGPQGERLRAVRAVDTATHPDAQGRGIFTRLTRAAVEELTADGDDFVFNTPNDQSRPGYLKMGWQIVGRPPVAVRPRRPSGLVAMARARVPAAKWSTPTPAGRRAEVALDDQGLTALLGATGDGGARLRTEHTLEHLRWRYRFAPLHYRAVVGPDGVGSGLAVFRLRRRGRALEATVCELLAPEPSVARGLLSQISAATGADYLIVAGTAAAARSRHLVPLPGQGPVLTWRALASPGPAPALADWDLSLGDLELF